MTEEEERVISKQYGKNARPILLKGKTVEELIRANCTREHESAWRKFAKSILV